MTITNPDTGRFRFYIGLHQPSDAKHFTRACISVNRLLFRQKPIGARVLLDSGAFTMIAAHGGYPEPVSVYAGQIRRLSNGIIDMDAAVAQDYMCEPFMVERTGLTVAEHQRLTIERYDALIAEGLDVPILPVLQGYDPADYARHVEVYGNRLGFGAWVGVGSVCKRNGSPGDVLNVLATIKTARPDLRLHGFGVKTTSLLHGGVRALLGTADSMAWSYAARRQGRSPNDWREAMAFAERIENINSFADEPWQMPLAL